VTREVTAVDKPKPVTIIPYHLTFDGIVKSSYTEEQGLPGWKNYYREEEMDAYPKTLTEKILDLEAKLRHYQRNHAGDAP
jgi:tryptophan 2,3-dioxygenase